MAVKYVKDFAFDSGFGFSGSSGKTPVRGYMRGGAVKDKGFNNSTRNPMSNFPDIAPAMVGKGPGKMGGKTSDVKPLSKAKANPQIAKYAKGGAVKKAMGGMVPTKKPPKVPLAGPPTMEEFDRAARTAEFRDTNRNGIDDRDELKMAQRMSKQIRAGMARPRMDRRGMAMIGREDERMLDMDRVRSRTPKAPVMRPYMPEFNLDPEEIREYSRGRTFSPAAMYKKGGRVSKGEKKIGTVMREFKKGESHAGSKKGPVVTNPKQATAIALSEARKAGAKIPKKAEGGKIKAAVHKHEREKHPDSPLTKLRKGGMACG